MSLLAPPGFPEYLRYTVTQGKGNKESVLRGRQNKAALSSHVPNSFRLPPVFTYMHTLFYTSFLLLFPGESTNLFSGAFVQQSNIVFNHTDTWSSARVGVITQQDYFETILYIQKNRKTLSHKKQEISL